MHLPTHGNTAHAGDGPEHHTTLPYGGPGGWHAHAPVRRARAPYLAANEAAEEEPASAEDGSVDGSLGVG